MTGPTGASDEKRSTERRYQTRDWLTNSATPGVQLLFVRRSLDNLHSQIIPRRVPVAVAQEAANEIKVGDEAPTLP